MDAADAPITESKDPVYKIARKLSRVENPTDTFSVRKEDLPCMPMSEKLYFYYKHFYPWRNLCEWLCESPAVRVESGTDSLPTGSTVCPLPVRDSSRDWVTGIRLLQVRNSKEEIAKCATCNLAPLVNKLNTTSSKPAKVTPSTAKSRMSSDSATESASGSLRDSLLPLSQTQASIAHTALSNSFVFGLPSYPVPNSATFSLIPNSFVLGLPSYPVSTSSMFHSVSDSFALEHSTSSGFQVVADSSSGFMPSSTPGAIPASPLIAPFSPFKPGMAECALMELSCASSASPLSDVKSDMIREGAPDSTTRKRHVSALHDSQPDGDGYLPLGHEPNLLEILTDVCPPSVECPVSTPGSGVYDLSAPKDIPSVSFSLKLKHREFAFASYYGNANGNTTSFMRYLSANTPEELREVIVKYCPFRFEIGPMFIHAANNKDSAMANVPRYRELVFDIDGPNYDPVRPCCRGKKGVCPKCWKLIKYGMKVITRVLREDFGLTSPQWVFSGWKGVHCFYSGMVSLIRESSRRHVADYFSVKHKNAALLKTPYIQKCFESMVEVFLDRVKNDGLLEDAATVDHLLSFVPNTQLRDELRRIEGTSIERWSTWYTMITRTSRRATLLGYSDRAVDLKNSLDFMIIEAVAPRLDEPVTIKKDHLIKAPFCIHPETSKVCVPIPVEDFEIFDPRHVPTLDQIISRKVATFVMT